MPLDFKQRHLLVDAHAVVVWSRLGVAVAYDGVAEDRAETLRQQVEELSAISADVQQLVATIEVTHTAADSRHGTGLATQLAEGDRLLARVATLRHELAQPEGRPLRRLFEALSFRDRNPTACAIWSINKRS